MQGLYIDIDVESLLAAFLSRIRKVHEGFPGFIVAHT